MKLDENCCISNNSQRHTVMANHNIWKVLVLQNFASWIYLDFYLSLVYFIMQNYLVTREWDETDWLDPLISRLANFLFLEKSAINCFLQKTSSTLTRKKISQIMKYITFFLFFFGVKHLTQKTTVVFGKFCGAFKKGEIEIWVTVLL